MIGSRDFVDYALSIGAIELLPEGRKLKSGRLSPYFFNSGLFNTGQRIAVLAEAYASAMLKQLNVIETLYGPPYKGIPLVTAVGMKLSASGKDVGISFSRKEKKDHGEGGFHVGASLKNKGVAIIDDVITTSVSVREAKDYVVHAGGFPTGVYIGFDRQVHAVDSELSATQSLKAETGLDVHAAATLNDLIAVLETSNDRLHKTTLPLILKYKEKYGVAV
jgi:orotate phosphoribosyltransferase